MKLWIITLQFQLKKQHKQTNKQTNKQSNLLTLVKSENNKTEIKNLIKIIMETIILMTLQHN